MGSDPDPIFNTYHLFLATLLADAPSLAASASLADLALVPAFGTNMDGLLEYYEHAAAQVARRFPAAWRERDHVWITSGDGGGCDLNRLPSLRRSIIAAHYLKLNVTEAYATSRDSCGRPGKDVAIPPDVPTVAQPAYLARGLAPLEQRPGTFFFAGNVPEKHLVDQTPDEQLEREAYSEGVRQLLWKYQRLTPGFKVVDRSPTYAEDYASTRYCLAPLGVGWGVRLLWAIEAGCIPVLFSSQVAAWFEDAIDYGSFALRGLPKTALRTLPAVLEAFSPAQRAALQASLWRHRHLFLWRGGGFAYNMTLHELCWRARRRRAKVHCAALLPEEIASLVIPAAARTNGVGGREPRRARLSGP